MSRFRIALVSAASSIALFSASAIAQESLGEIDVAPISPVEGGEIKVEKVPGGVNIVDEDVLNRAGPVEVQDSLQKYVPGAIITDSAGSTFRTQLEYRGFGAGSVTGFPQGLAVYQNGVRINEVFGDVTNWDLIPSNAIKGITIQSGNPVYGLNALGGGVAIELHDGFSFEGVEIDVMGGSFGRKQIGTRIGVKSGNWALFWAGEHIEEDGYRDFSEADIDRMYADLGVKGSKVEAHLSLTWADSLAGVVAASPVELLEIDRARTFTSPQTTELEVIMPVISASVKATETMTISGNAYYRRFRSNVIDGNLLEGEECEEVQDDNPGAGVEADFDPENVCSEEIEDNEITQLRDAFGNPISGDDIGEPFGIIDRISQEAESFGGSIQAVEKMRLFGMPNQFLAGASYDRGNVAYQTSSEIGQIGNRFVVNGSGITVTEPDDFAPRNVDVDSEYIGFYFSNTLDVTNELAVTVGGRYNIANIDLVDLTGEFEGITSSHEFDRFNPSAGATYQLMPGLTLYGGYSESNRAPTPGELACANPDNPCPIESFLTDDPPLKQVVSNTYEVGLRGKMGSSTGNERLDWTLGYFNTLNKDDILFVAAATTGRGFFFNGGDTRRQGIEAGINYENGPLSLYANYSWVRATYEDTIEFQSPSHPLAGPCVSDEVEDICITATPGDRIPGIAEHRFKAGFDYMITPQWKFGADVIAASGQHFLTDEANLLSKLAGYTRVDLHTSYDVNENVQIYGFVNNVFDKKYGLFGTLFEADEASEAAEASGLGADFFSNPRSIVPAPPVAGYGGVRVKF